MARYSPLIVLGILNYIQILYVYSRPLKGTEFQIKFSYLYAHHTYFLFFLIYLNGYYFLLFLTIRPFLLAFHTDSQKQKIYNKLIGNRIGLQNINNVHIYILY